MERISLANSYTYDTFGRTSDHLQAENDAARTTADLRTPDPDCLRPNPGQFQKNLAQMPDAESQLKTILSARDSISPWTRPTQTKA